MKIRIFYKLLLTLLVSFTGLMLVLLLVINTSFREGFADYLIDREMEAVRAASQRLEEYYDQMGSWQELRRNRRLWRDLLESASIPFPARPAAGPSFRPPRPDMRGAPPGQHPPSLVASDTQPIHRRLTLVDAQRNHIFGSRNLEKVARWLPIKSNEAVAGYLGLTPLPLETDSLAQRFVDQQRENIWMIALSGILVVLLISALLARLFVRPVDRVTRAANELAEGDLSIRVPVQGGDELATLSDNFNRMASKLQQNEQTRRQWLSDISHELRTPIAVLGGEIEALVDGIRQPSPQRISSLHNEVNSLARLVEDLHQLSLSDQGVMDMRFSDVDLFALCQEQCDLFEPRMAAASLQLSLHPLGNFSFHMQGDERRLGQVITNLLENSIRYTDPGGSVELRLGTEEKHLVLELRDSAPGVPEDALQRIFERLYRVDKSRSRAKGGSGLGLSICRTIIEAHGGEISASNRATGGLKITMRLPRSH